ncbi:MAG: ABC transporter substrate-binding protein [Candidatus Bathyarchaeota archaeon]
MYFELSKDVQSEDIIKIGFCGDIDMTMGSRGWKGALLAVEQINSEGGILGKTIKLIVEDSDYEISGDIAVASQAFTRLITLDKVNFIISTDGDRAIGAYQEISSQNQVIYFTLSGLLETWTQRVLDEYDKFKYFFRAFPSNSTAYFMNIADSLDTLRDYSGFNKVGLLTIDLPSLEGLANTLESVLEQNYGFEVSYIGLYPMETVDFSSYYANAEAAGTEILVPITIFDDGIPLAKEWYDRQSPMVTWGLNPIVSDFDGWESVEGKCEKMSLNAPAVTTGYPLTTQTLTFSNSFFDRWGDVPDGVAAAAYDSIRFILYDAINRVGTIETDSVIDSLEETHITTSMAGNFVFTSSHDVMVGKNPNNPNDNYLFLLFFQWQNGKQVPVYPQKIMEEAGATYQYPPWSGPWDAIE